MRQHANDYRFLDRLPPLSTNLHFLHNTNRRRRLRRPSQRTPRTRGLSVHTHRHVTSPPNKPTTKRASKTANGNRWKAKTQTLPPQLNPVQILRKETLPPDQPMHERGRKNTVKPPPGKQTPAQPAGRLSELPGNGEDRYVLHAPHPYRVDNQQQIHI